MDVDRAELLAAGLRPVESHVAGTDAVGQRWVLCRSPLGWPLAFAHDVEREYWILSALHTSAVPCPSVLGLPAAAIDSQSVDDLVARALRLADLDGI
jgi:aminoglycoside phosphotransferase (APT) family kinase protein